MKVRNIALPVALLMVVASLPFWFIQSFFMLNVATLTLIFMCSALAWNLISGYGGQLSFGHSVFFGIGAYTSVLLFIRAGVSPWIGLFAGGLLASVVAVVLGYPSFRLRGIYFALVTFTTTLIFEILARHFEDLTGGDVGLSVPLFKGSAASFQFENELWYYYIALVLVAIYFVVSQLVYRSRLGFFLRSIRDDQEAAQASGVNVLRAKMVAFVLSAFLTAITGTLYVQLVLFIDPQTAFGLEVAVLIALPAIAGGLGTVWGPVIGTAVLIPLQQGLSASLTGFPPALSLIIYAVVVIAIMLLDPRGMYSLGKRATAKVDSFWRKQGARNTKDIEEER
jgi:branched-chain amino acid transport system permease protein